MFSYILTGILFVMMIVKLYKNRAFFKKLKRNEWLRFITVYVCAWAAAAIVIIGGAALAQPIEADWLRMGIGVVLIIIGLNIAGTIMEKFLPQRFKELYS